MFDLHKRSIRERTLRRCAKAETEKVFADILDDILKTITGDSINFSFEHQDISQDSINNISESTHSDEDLQFSINDNNNEYSINDNNNEYTYVIRDLLASIESEENSR